MGANFKHGGLVLIGSQKRWQEELFVAGPLSSLIPDDHILMLVDKVLELSWLRDEVKDLYCCDNGRPGIDPEAAVRLMLAGFFQGIIHDRKLMREAQVNIAIRWFAGYRLGEKLPDHSSLTKIRQRWGDERFKKIFQKTVQSCVDAGLVSGEMVHIDATLIRADVSWESLTTEHTEAVIEQNDHDGGKFKGPAGKLITRRTQNKQGWLYRAQSKDCRRCHLRNRCISRDASSRSVLISYGYEALLRARRRHRRPDDKFVETYKRHRWRTEGVHGQAKTQHGLRHAVRRGLSNVTIQAYLTAAVINLKRLAASVGLLFVQFCFYSWNLLAQRRLDVTVSKVSTNFGRKYATKKAG